MTIFCQVQQEALVQEMQNIENAQEAKAVEAVEAVETEEVETQGRAEGAPNAGKKEAQAADTLVKMLGLASRAAVPIVLLAGTDIIGAPERRA